MGEKHSKAARFSTPETVVREPSDTSKAYQEGWKNFL